MHACPFILWFVIFLIYVSSFLPCSSFWFSSVDVYGYNINKTLKIQNILIQSVLFNKFSDICMFIKYTKCNLDVHDKCV